jgi:hypothetical protein
MNPTELQAIADTLMRVVTPSMTPKQLLKAAKKEHPDASKRTWLARRSSRSLRTLIKTSANLGICKPLRWRSEANNLIKIVLELMLRDRCPPIRRGKRC